ncbi:hypothetical protein [Longimicrobium terrae]|uniref:DUF1795 domain-containing protein n=1 Tax=Longimicrobium terrae TaxID=1639882 RepID=A0A841GU71_9BACT|nr:hypothetical protein [Longimicrobium terrae]MBB4634252.1 hypothetical protein [Longimicrobium terrae]MBB6068858.1 hypothetical protein [Longimicrobium terrae]NNC28038.1 hypothetical protein [Longimicrobium terrae]
MRIRTVLFALLLSCTAAAANAQGTAQLVEHTALGGKVALMAPADFSRMSPEMLRAKYPTQRPPTEVLSNERGTVSIAFNHTQQAMAPAQIREAHAALEGQLKSTFPTARWNRSEVVRRGTQDVAVLDFWSPTADGEVRNIMVVSSVDGRAMIVSFNVTRELEGEWGAVGERIMNSIRVAGVVNPI